ncbi:MAG: glycoside hydrolase family 3 C-terminal domain-containing protein [Acetatifactor sp.]|nr:glycoside hydrolase family 3 C-terminal domain-containing protein [Acetatifactor sp.]
MKQAKTKKIVAGVVALLLLVCAIFLLINKNVFSKKSDAQGEVTQSEEVTEDETTEKVKNDDVAEVDKSVYMDSSKSVEERVESLLAQMTLREKAAQMVQPEQNGITLEQITKYGVGSILSGGGSAPTAGNKATHWEKHINEIKQAALDSRLGIPVLYGVDAVHGHNNVYGATVFPHNIGLGAANDEELMARIGEVVAEEVRATGIQWTFAPCLGNAQNELWGRTYECFGEDTDIVARLGAAFARGVQGEPESENYLTDTHVLATAKHYIGEGFTAGGTNQGDVKMDADSFEALLQDSLLEPYRAQLEDGVLTVMVSFSSVNGEKCHESTYLIKDVLKGQLGFNGLVVSDYNGIEQIAGATFKAQVGNAVNAGIDLFMEPYNWETTISAIEALVKDGTITEEQIDDSVRRILRVKFEAGLFEEQVGSDTELALMEEFGSEEHREVAREAVRKSMVLLKNDKVGQQTAMEILQNAQNISVLGTKANDLGTQCGGWTISWQGSTGKITEGTTIMQGITDALPGRTVLYSAKGELTGEEDAVIVVIGEKPYAETSGDRSSSNLTIDKADSTMVQNADEALKAAREKGVPVVAVLLTGRPVTIADYVDSFDAIVEAWLPGTEGAGVADVFFGDYDFTGTLSFTWPWYASDIEKKFEDESLVLFKKGTGLRKDGTGIQADGTVAIGAKPEKTEEELNAISEGSINLETVGYVLEAENFTEDSYLVNTGNANNISYVDSWSGEWANAKWDVWVPEAGDYRLHFFIAADKDSKTVDIYYNTPTIEDDGNANRTNVPMTKTASMTDYEDFTLDVTLEKGSYQFKFMNTKADGADFRLDRIEFEHIN